MATTLRGARENRIAAIALPGALAFVWLCALTLGHFETAALGAQLASAVLAAPLAWWALSRHRPTHSDLRLLAAATVPVTLMLVAALTSGDVRHSLLGAPPLWQGWFLWAGVLSWFCFVALGAKRHDLLGVARVLAASGTASALWALAQLGGLFGGFDPADAGALAVFDNPQSLGQALTVTIAATLALILLERTEKWRHVRIALGFAAAIQIAALVGASDRAALLGLGVGAAAFALTTPGDSVRRRGIRVLGASGLALFLAAFAFVCIAWSGNLGTSAFLKTDALLTSRLGVWNEAAEKTVSHLALGEGPANFESVVTWSVLPDGRIDAWRTYSEHSILLTWMVGAGVFGVAAFALGAIAVGLRVARVVRASRTPDAVRSLAAGCAATFVAMLFSWPDPLALVSVTCIAGCLVAAGSVRVPASQPERRMAVPALVVAAATLLALISLAPDIVGQYRLGTATSTNDYMRDLKLAVSTTHDPAYLEGELSAAETGGAKAMSDARSVELLEELASDYPAAARHRIDIPALALELTWQRRSAMSAAEFWRLSRFFTQRGMGADPDLGMWRYALARAAVDARRRDTEHYVTAALSDRQPDGAQALLHAWELRARSTETSGTR